MSEARAGAPPPSQASSLSGAGAAAAIASNSASTHDASSRRSTPPSPRTTIVAQPSGRGGRRMSGGGGTRRRRSSAFSVNSTDEGDGRGSFWTRLAQRRSSTDLRRGSSTMTFDVDDDDGRDRNGSSMAGLCRPRPLSSRRCAKRSGETLDRSGQNLGLAWQKTTRNPRILLPTLFTFAVLTAAGLAVVIISADRYREERSRALLEQGRQMAYVIDDGLSRALLPLFTLREMAGQVDELRALAGRLEGPGSTGPHNTTVYRDGHAWRNVTDLCTSPTSSIDYSTNHSAWPYPTIAESIMESSKMGKTLLNLQLQPAGVVCLNHPLTTTYDDGYVMDNARSVGLDVVNDPMYSTGASRAIEERRDVAAMGPMRLVQNTEVAPHESLIFRAPVFLEGFGLTTAAAAAHPLAGINETGTGAAAQAEAEATVTYPDFWGFAAVLLDWSEYASEVELYEYFELRGMGFALVKELGGGETETIAASAAPAPPTLETAAVSVPLRMKGLGWILLLAAPPRRVGVPHWEIWGSILVLLGAAIVSLALMVILVTKADHDNLLYRIMPRDVVKRLKSGKTVIERYDDATLCYIDIVSFTTMSGRMKAVEVMDMLRILFTEFDRLAEKHNVFNVETIGDAYIVIGGGPEGDDGPTGAANVAAFALDAIDVVRDLVFEGGRKVLIRVGLGSGAVVAGVVGTTFVPKFTLFGETVSRACAMEASSIPGKVQCTDETMRLLRSKVGGGFECTMREEGGGNEKTWWIIRAPAASGRASAASGWSRSSGSIGVESVEEATIQGLSRQDAEAKQPPEQPGDAGIVDTQESVAIQNLSDLTRTNDAWHDDEIKGKKASAIGLREFCSGIPINLRSVGRLFKIAATNRRILLTTFFTFAVLCGVGLAVLFVFASSYEDDLYNSAVNKAKEADRWLFSELNKALLPLFAMSEIVKNLDKMYDLPFKMDETSNYNKGDTVFRNVTGICDSPAYRSPFVDIATHIKESSEMQRILVNVQLAPHGVLCLTHPLNNTEDFPPGKFLDTSGAIGLDLFATPSRADLSKKAVKKERFSIQGPISLVQGNLSVVDEALIARYPVYIDGHKVSIDGTNYPFWGFTIVLLDWNKLKKKFGLYNFFERNAMEFRMTRYDSFNQRVAVIAKSPRHSILQEDNSVSVPLQTTDNSWTLTVGYQTGFNPPWLPWGCACVVVGSFLISMLVMMVLAASKEHKMLLYRMMPGKAIRRLQRGETYVERDSNATIFFSHIIGFATLSGQMKADDFLVMLTQLYEELDELAAKHHVSKVETIGAAYIVTAPGPERCAGWEREGVVRVALFALDALEFMKNYRYKNMRLYIRAGLATGPIVSGVIGAALPKYTVFGDTVNFASRMESTSKQMMIQCPLKSHKLLRESEEYDFETEERREGDQVGVYVKGKGQELTYWIKGCNRDDGAANTARNPAENVRRDNGDAASPDVEA